MIKDNPNNIKFVSALFNSQSGSNDHFIRTSAVPRGKEKGLVIGDSGNVPKGTGVSEHPLTSKFMSTYMFHMVVYNEVKNMFPFIEKNYYQIALSSETNNKLSRKKGDFNYQDYSIENYDYRENLPQELRDKIDNAIKNKDWKIKEDRTATMMQKSYQANFGERKRFHKSKEQGIYCVKVSLEYFTKEAAEDEIVEMKDQNEIL